MECLEKDLYCKERKEKKTLLIVNPLAGRKMSSVQVNEIVEILKQGGHDCSIYFTKFKNHATRIVRKNIDNFDLIICCGGDGTFHEVINGVLQSKKQVPIGYIPTGTTNDLAKSLNLPKNLKEAALLINKNNIYKQDVGMFEEEDYFSYVASFGAFCEVPYTTPQKVKNILGHFAYILAGMKSIREICPYHLKVTCDDRTIEGNFIFGAIMNSTSIGGIIDIKKENVYLDDGKFEVLLVKKSKNPIDFCTTLKDLLNKQYDSKYITFCHASKIKIESDKKMSFTLDGEYVGKLRHIKIVNLNKAIKIIK